MVNVIISFRPHQGLSNFLSNGECLIILQRQVSVPIRGYLISYLQDYTQVEIGKVSVPIRGYLISYPVSVTLVFMHPDYLLCGAKFIIL